MGFTALIWAARNGHTDTVSALIAAGANVNAASRRGNTVLILAAWHGHTAIVSALISAGADVNAVNQDGHTALTLAVSAEHHEAALCLLNSMSPQAIAATRPTPSFTVRLLRRQPAITHVEAAYNQALMAFRQGLNNMISAFNADANRHSLGTANPLLGIIAAYYCPVWCRSSSQEINHVLTERTRAMNRLRPTLTSFTNTVTSAVAGVKKKTAAGKEMNKKI